jgi:hypothetical protein
MEEYNQSLEDRTRFLEIASSQIKRAKRNFAISIVAPLVINTLGFFAGLEIGTYINRQIHTEINKPQMEIVQYEQDPHKYSPKRQISDNPHHYIPNSE